MATKTKNTKKIRVTLIKSTIGQKPQKVATVKALGLKKLNTYVEHNADAPILGMVNSVAHLVKVEELD